MRVTVRMCLCLFTLAICVQHIVATRQEPVQSIVAAIFRSKYLKQRQGMGTRATSHTGGADRRAPNVSQVWLRLFRTQAQTEIRV